MEGQHSRKWEAGIPENGSEQEFPLTPGYTHFQQRFCVGAKLAFSDWPQAPKGPKTGQKGPFGAINGKTRIIDCKGTEMVLILPVETFWIDS